jgi:hypothetical protein
MATNHSLPSKVSGYLRRLALEYGHSNAVLKEVIDTSRFIVIEGTDYDNWNGGTYGHDLLTFVPLEVMKRLRFDKQKELASALKDDLNKCAESVQNEYFRDVSFNLEDDNDTQCQRAFYPSKKAQTNPDNLAIWKSGHLRLFISHKDEHKAAVKLIADGLEPLGVSGFVAHDSIEPLTTWQHEIQRGLDTMEVMLVCITHNFHSSIWTNQEVGFALGKGIPIIPLKLEGEDPAGFIGNIQAIRGDLNDPKAAVAEIYKVLCTKLGQGKRLHQTLIAAFVSSPNYDEARSRFDRLSSTGFQLSENQLDQIVSGFNGSDILPGAYYLTNSYRRLEKFLKAKSGKDFHIVNGKLSEKSAWDSDLPF